MFFTATINPHADAERHFDALFDAGEAADDRELAEAKRLADEFVRRLPLGGSAPLEGRTVADAMYEIVCSSYAALLDEIVIAAGVSTDPALCRLVRKLGEGWADLMIEQAKKEGAMQ